MLVLSRRTGESIIIDGRIVVTVTEIRGDKVRIGVTAPADVRIDRREIHELRQKRSSGTDDERVNPNNP
jgi:carbon storage regulator